MFSRLQKTLDALLFPPVCPVCAAPVLENGALCPDCFAKLQFMPPAVCACCGVPLPDSMQGEGLCLQCVRKKPVFDGVYSAFKYDETSRALIFSLKYGAKFDVVSFMADAMGRAGEKLLAKADVLVPVPLHRWRLLSRRFNQSVLLANAIAKRYALPVDPFALKRCRHTHKQGRFSPFERFKNVKGVFAADATAFKGKRAVIVDDVFTTGATAGECAKTLKRAGAVGVGVVTFARALED